MPTQHPPPFSTRAAPDTLSVVVYRQQNHWPIERVGADHDDDRIQLTVEKKNASHPFAMAGRLPKLRRLLLGLLCERWADEVTASDNQALHSLVEAYKHFGNTYQQG